MMVALRSAQEQVDGRQVAHVAQPPTAVKLAAANTTSSPKPASPSPKSKPKHRRQPVFSIFRPEGFSDELLPFVRRSSLPEHIEYADTGCELAPSCLACPLPRCQYDEPSNVRAWLTQARDREIAYIRRRYGVRINILARTYGLTRRTIFRILREQRTKS
jgi:hypothetical protein